MFTREVLCMDEMWSKGEVHYIGEVQSIDEV